MALPILMRVLKKLKKHSSSCSGERYIVLLVLIPRLSPPVLYASLSKLAKCIHNMRLRISRSVWQGFFFAAIAATTIRAILPFSLRLRECFLYFQKTRLSIAVFA